jgi:hypothetical protein
MLAEWCGARNGRRLVSAPPYSKKAPIYGAFLMLGCALATALLPKRLPHWVGRQFLRFDGGPSFHRLSQPLQVF